MSDKKEKTIPELQSEYQGLCVKAGHIQYQIYALSKDLEMLNSQMRDINLEASLLSSKEKENEKTS